MFKSNWSPAQTKASRLRAMEKDYHLECFKSVVKILIFGQIGSGRTNQMSAFKPMQDVQLKASTCWFETKRPKCNNKSNICRRTN